MAYKKISTQRVLGVAFFVNVLDIVTNGIVTIFTGSAVVFSEMLQGFADLAASGLLLYGHKASQRPAGKLHPFGYGKETFFWSLMATIVMFVFTSFGSVYRGYSQLVAPHVVEHIWAGLLVTSFGVVTNFYAVWLNYKKIKKPNESFAASYKRSPGSSLKTSFVSDLIGTSAAVVGLVALILYVFTGQIFFDAIGAIVIGVIIAILNFQLFWEIKGYLIGRAASPELEARIIDETKKISGVEEVLDLRTMFLGPKQLLINIEVNLNDDLRTDGVESVMDKIRDHLRKQIPEASHIQIEAESLDTNVKVHEDIEIKHGGKNAKTKESER